MKSFCSLLMLFCCLLQVEKSLQRKWVTSDELENHISPEDLREFMHFYDRTTTARPDTIDKYATMEETTALPVPNFVDCFGLGSISRAVLSFFNMKPDDPEKVNTHFYLSSRQTPKRVHVYPGEQFGLEWTDFKPTRKTVMIVHGFMSHSNASWVNDMTRAFLEWDDVNVIAVDWSGGGNTWKYWRAVANTRRVGSDVTRFLRQLMQATGARIKDFHFVGHSLGAHISSFASYHLGRVSRITGLDPAEPCFSTSSDVERLGASDADFVDIIHTNGRLLKKIGFGIPEPIGHADFYPNGGLRQPGCSNRTGRSLLARMMPFSPSILEQAVCSHGRAYVLFTESLINANCSFRAYRWDLSYEGVNTSLNSTCNGHKSCPEMGIKAVGGKGSPRAQGPYFLLTTDKEPYCELCKDSQSCKRFPLLSSIMDLLRDLRKGRMFSSKSTTPAGVTSAYADPEIIFDNPEDRSEASTTATQKSWYAKWFG